ncbi:MAG: glycosyltransferase family 2 protein [Deltaproteobacteria bacterium]|nr:glycosyltransferase family 2 protein [Deltaproteobacteria bacterium]
MLDENAPQSVCAVVVTYFPDALFPLRVAKVSEQVDHLIVVDNGTTGPTASGFGRVLVRPGITLIRNVENTGVAAALNRGVKEALSRGFPWVLLLDQDSTPMPGMVATMVECGRAFPHEARPAILGPRTEIENYDGDAGWRPGDGPWKEVSHVITSGSLVSTAAFQAVGGFQESLFIDYVDIEYCLRLRSRGFRVVHVRDAVLRHRLGRIAKRRFLRRTVHPSHHDPVRRYYQFRNALLVQRAYKRHDPAWRRTNRLILIKIACLMLLFERRRLKKFLQALRGIRHGLLGRAGRHGEVAFQVTKVPSELK